jgi:hypothetical protein
MAGLKNGYGWKAVTCGKLRSALRSQQREISLKHNPFETDLRGYFTAENIGSSDIYSTVIFIGYRI